MSNILGVKEFLNKEPCLEGEEVFGSQKCKLDMPLGCEYDSHRPNKVNFCHPYIQMRSKRAFTSIQNLNPIVEDVFPSANVEIKDPMATEDNLKEGFIHRVPHVSAIQESNCHKL